MLESFLIKIDQSFKLSTLLKKTLQYRCFTVNTAKFLRIYFYIKHLWWLFLSVNLTVHFGFSDFMDSILAKNLIRFSCTAAWLKIYLHLSFSNFMHGSPAKNLTAVHLSISNFLHGSPAEKRNEMKRNEMKYILFSNICINIQQLHVIAENKTQGNL